MTLRETKEKILSDPEHWQIHLMDFVDDFRYHKNPAALAESSEEIHETWDPLLASTASYLCDEMNIRVPQWIENIPACKIPWFVSGIENLKAIALVESPLRFRIRKIFVLGNFLSRA